MVAVPAGLWRPYAAPLAFLLAASIAVALIRPALRHHHRAHAAASKPAPVRHEGRSVYVVRPGDTLGSIAAKTHVTLAALRRLNPKVVPTALFIGQKIRLR